jgi:hypothetical protein
MKKCHTKFIFKNLNKIFARTDSIVGLEPMKMSLQEFQRNQLHIDNRHNNFSCK